MKTKVAKAFVTTREAADMLGTSLTTVQLWAERGLLSCWKTDGGHRRIPRESVERLLATRVTTEGFRRAPGSAPTLMAAPTAAANPQQAARQALKILVVEDEPTLLRLYRLQLARWELQPQVTTAASGIEALVHMGSMRPDLLITDLYMPEMDGFQMLRTLRAMPYLDAMEIVVVTGLNAVDIARSGGLPAGITVLAKPIPFVDLEKIAERLASQSNRTPACPTQIPSHSTV